jgi:hypothetical protein
MAWARSAPTAVRLGDGRVLVLGDLGGKYEGVPETSRFAEVWDPATERWSEAEFLPKARGSFAAIDLPDGRALVAGGINADWFSYSSAYVFDPGSARWTKTGVMATGRTSPAAAILPDGRVLVAGGGYFTGVPAQGRAADAQLVSLHLPLADTWPGPTGHALATAELYDPAAGTWSATGSMRFARFSAMAVTLGDGRVLVVGSGMGWDNPTDERAALTPEIYDPATGTFSLAGTVPAVDPVLLERMGVPPDVIPRIGGLEPLGGVLVASGGDALLVGASRTVRYSAGTGQWSDVGEPYVEWCPGSFDENDQCTVEMAHVGARHPDGFVVTLKDGRVLAGGGWDASGMGARTAELLDPSAGTWSDVGPMPGGRATAAAVGLIDGRVLVAGGYSNGGDGYPIALADAFLFVPGS